MWKKSWIIAAASFLLYSGTLLADEGGHREHSPAEASKPAVETVTSHNHEEDIPERPANKKVLGAFLAVNAAFLTYGAWKKYGVTKEGKPT